MTSKILSVTLVFLASLFIGFNSMQVTEVVQAMPVPTLELPKLPLVPSVKKESTTVDVFVDLKSNEVSLKGTVDNANVNIVQKEKIVYKYRTKVRKDTVKVATHPVVKMLPPELPSLKKTLGYE